MIFIRVKNDLMLPRSILPVTGLNFARNKGSIITFSSRCSELTSDLNFRINQSSLLQMNSRRWQLSRELQKLSTLCSYLTHHIPYFPSPINYKNHHCSVSSSCHRGNSTFLADASHNLLLWPLIAYWFCWRWSTVLINCSISSMYTCNHNFLVSDWEYCF